MKVKLLLITLSSFCANNILSNNINTINTESAKQDFLINCKINNYHHENAVASCFDVWKIIDIARAIKSSTENRKHFCNELVDKVAILYADVLRINKHEKLIIKPDELKFILDLFNNIKAQFFDAFYDVDSSEFYCISLMLDRIDNVFKELVN